jgi:photosystem II stability/assembly factor-like uncharacterized protein
MIGPQTLPVGVEVPPDSRLGFAVGCANTILKTTDGGITWRRVIERELKGPEFGQVLFTSVSNGWAVSASVLLHTVDAGEHWLPAARLPGNFYYYGSGSGTKAFFHQMQPANYGNRIYRTADGGRQWVTLPAPFPRNNYQAMYFLDDLKAWVVGSRGGVTYTVDGGNSWTKADIPGAGDLVQVQFVSPTHGWTRSVHGHQGGPWATRDGGVTWTVQPANVKPFWTILDMQFINENVGFLLVARGADSSVVMKTGDGGATWSEVGIYPPGLTAICSPAPGAACAVGAQGKFYRLKL